MSYSDFIKQINELYLSPIAAVVTIAAFLIPFFFIPKRMDKTEADSPKIFRIIQLVQSTSESTSELFRDVSVFVSILVLGYDVALVVGLVGSLVKEGNNLFDVNIIILLIILFVLPIWMLRDYYKTEVRQRRGEHSKVFQQSGIDLTANYDSLVARCFQILSDMGARITDYNSVNRTFMAELPSNKIEIKITPLQNEEYRVFVSSDSKKPTVRIDFGINQKYVNDIITKLIGYG